MSVKRKLLTLHRRHDWLTQQLEVAGARTRTDYHWMAQEQIALAWALELLESLIELRRVRNQDQSGDGR